MYAVQIVKSTLNNILTLSCKFLPKDVLQKPALPSLHYFKLFRQGTVFSISIGLAVTMTQWSPVDILV